MFGLKWCHVQSSKPWEPNSCYMPSRHGDFGSPRAQSSARGDGWQTATLSAAGGGLATPLLWSRTRLAVIWWK